MSWEFSDSLDAQSTWMEAAVFSSGVHDLREKFLLCDSVPSGTLSPWPTYPLLISLQASESAM